MNYIEGQNYLISSQDYKTIASQATFKYAESDYSWESSNYFELPSGQLISISTTQVSYSMIHDIPTEYNTVWYNLKTGQFVSENDIVKYFAGDLTQLFVDITHVPIYAKGAKRRT